MQMSPSSSRFRQRRSPAKYPQLAEANVCCADMTVRISPMLRGAPDDTLALKSDGITIAASTSMSAVRTTHPVPPELDVSRTVSGPFGSSRMVSSSPSKGSSRHAAAIGSVLYRVELLVCRETKKKSTVISSRGSALRSAWWSFHVSTLIDGVSERASRSCYSRITRC